MATEFSLIESLRKVLARPGSRVIRGIGDDAAVLKPTKRNLLATVDMMVEGVHFDLKYTIPQEVGYKAMAVNLSDVAAMGGRPLYALVSLGIPDRISAAFVQDLYRGMRQLGQKYHVPIVGGNIARSMRKLVVDLTLLGEAPQNVVLRSGAKPGHLLCVTGNLGTAAAGLFALKKMERSAIQKFSTAVRAQLQPRPKVNEGQALGRSGLVSAMIDISDGLAAEIHHLAQQSGVGFRLDRSRIPISRACQDVAAHYGQEATKWALEGGEDYELLFTLPPRNEARVRALFKRQGRRFHILGEALKRKEGVVLDKAGKLSPLTEKGWDHMAHRRRASIPH